MLWTNSGNFLVTSGQIDGLSVYGTDASGDVAWNVTGSGQPATGSVDLVAGTWFLNYADSGPQGQVTMHLEGTLVPY